MKVKTDGIGQAAAWQVRCLCGAVITQGDTTPPPTNTDVEQLADGHRHLQEAATGLHRLQVVVLSRITEHR